MSRLSSQAEVIKLGRLLGVSPAQLEFLTDLPSGSLHHFRTAISDQLFDEQRELIQAMAALTRWLPSWLAALLARYWLGATLTARLASELPAWRVAAIARYLPKDFMTNIAERLDPRGARELLYLLPAAQIAEIMQILLARRDYITLGRFVALLPDAVVSELAAHIPDEGDLIQIVFFIESRHRIDHLIRVLPRERIERAMLMVCDTERRPLWPHILSLLANASYGLKRELGELVASQGEDVLNAVVHAAQEEDLWEDLLPVVACLSPEVQRHVVNLASLQVPEVLQRILIATERKGLWTAMLALAEYMNEAGREALAAVLAEAENSMLERACYAALLSAQWNPLLDIARRLSPAKRQACLDILDPYLSTLDQETLSHLRDLLAHYGIAQQPTLPTTN